MCQDNEESVPQDFSLKIEFNYDIVKNLLLATSKGLTPCANSFSIAFKGGELDNGLQLWKSIPEETSETTYDMPCHNIEQKLYSIFDISCVKEHYGNIIVHIDSEANTFVLERENAVFLTDFISFEEDILSTNETTFENTKLIRSKRHHYIEFANIEKSDLYIEVFSILGEKIIKKIRYQKNAIRLNPSQKGLYTIKLSNSNNGFKTFKYVK